MPWQPAHEAHAIERVNVTFQFGEAVSSKLWSSMLNRATLDYQKKGFNVTTDGIEFAVSPIAPPQAMGMGASPAGVVPAAGAVLPGPLPIAGTTTRTLRRVVGNEVWEEVALSQLRFSYATTRYDRWVPFRQRLYELLEGLLNQALQVVDLNLVKMEYWDRFVFDGAPSVIDYGALFRSNSGLVANFYSGMAELWHSHIGHFVPSPAHTKRLFNLNVDVFDATDQGGLKRSAAIYSMAQDTISETPPSNASEAVPILDDQHKLLKEAMKSVIVPEMAERIGLNGKPES